MRKFIYFLQDTPKHPFEINAISKAEVKSLIMESVPDESHILAIYSEEEFNQKYNINNNQSTKQIINEEDDTEYNQNFANSNDYFNSMIKNVENNFSSETPNKIELPVNDSHVIATEQIAKHSQNNGVTYFEDDGISFKLENGKLYRKRWRNIEDASEKIEYRILRAKTKKECDKNMFEIEILDWVEFQQK